MAFLFDNNLKASKTCHARSAQTLLLKTWGKKKSCELWLIGGPFPSSWRRTGGRTGPGGGEFQMQVSFWIKNCKGVDPLNTGGGKWCAFNVHCSHRLTNLTCARRRANGPIWRDDSPCRWKESCWNWTFFCWWLHRMWSHSFWTAWSEICSHFLVGDSPKCVNTGFCQTQGWGPEVIIRFRFLHQRCTRRVSPSLSARTQLGPCLSTATSQSAEWLSVDHLLFTAEEKRTWMALFQPGVSPEDDKATHVTLLRAIFSPLIPAKMWMKEMLGQKSFPFQYISHKWTFPFSYECIRMGCVVVFLQKRQTCKRKRNLKREVLCVEQKWGERCVIHRTPEWKVKRSQTLGGLHKGQEINTVRKVLVRICSTSRICKDQSLHPQGNVIVLLGAFMSFFKWIKVRVSDKTEELMF